MLRYLMVFLVTLLLSVGVPAQDAGKSAEPDEETEEVEDDADLDEQTYEENEDDFVPTEEIPVDEPIPFPTNI